jgi:hypothetical protein
MAIISNLLNATWYETPMPAGRGPYAAGGSRSRYSRKAVIRSEIRFS